MKDHERHVSDIILLYISCFIACVTIYFVNKVSYFNRNDSKLSVLLQS